MLQSGRSRINNGDYEGDEKGTIGLNGVVFMAVISGLYGREESPMWRGH